MGALALHHGALLTSLYIDIQGQHRMLLAGLYFISPSPTSVARLAFDFGACEHIMAIWPCVVSYLYAGVLQVVCSADAGSMPMYQAAHVYFSSTLAPELLAELKSTPGLAAHLATLQEANLEFSVFDSRTFHTNQVLCHYELLQLRTCWRTAGTVYDMWLSVCHAAQRTSASVWQGDSRPRRPIPA